MKIFLIVVASYLVVVFPIAVFYGKLLKRRRLEMEAEQEGKKYDSIT
jgi:hypothetical protein